MNHCVRVLGGGGGGGAHELVLGSLTTNTARIQEQADSDASLLALTADLGLLSVSTNCLRSERLPTLSVAVDYLQAEQDGESLTIKRYLSGRHAGAFIQASYVAL